MPASPDINQLKSHMKTAWMAGDFGQIAAYSQKAAADFVERTPIKRGTKLLDVACGTGNTAIPAARMGAVVTGVDIATNLLEQARRRATAENLDIKFEEGDAEQLAYAADTFDVVLSMFGAMFAPRPELVAVELLRVCRTGAMVAMANWTPEGFVGKTFRLTSKLVPPPPGITPPVLWGDEKTVRERFATGVSELRMTRHQTFFEYPFPPKDVVAFFRQYFGPTQVAFGRLDENGKADLAAQLEALWMEHNLASDGTTKVEVEYLDVRAIKE